MVKKLKILLAWGIVERYAWRMIRLIVITNFPVPKAVRAKMVHVTSLIISCGFSVTG